MIKPSHGNHCIAVKTYQCVVVGLSVQFWWAVSVSASASKSDSESLFVLSCDICVTMLTLFDRNDATA